ncbi:adenylate/guanylate cyclase domain-containing protein [Xanthomonas arboricola pv. juglandis]|uniref:adenylate/guanylate cyclase domain-containing protein n=1 Tax=Xanthomonas arboricola TaxID=56448 RepID=UPI001AF0B4BB|nr:adenylate/guanylate cyclase domain-containing protein [Xanthomonas arboricola]CAG2092125.1 adenylate/guanylate cyclase domain-containing protein [Xanthomonas arboricola pv. juglandis]
MPIERIDATYQAKQDARIQSSLRRIDARPAIPTGRVIPENDDLAIYDGRSLNATILFLDICGFTSRPQETTQDQERLLRAISLFFSEMIRIIEDFGGTVEKNTGDGLMAYFVQTVSDSFSVQQRALSAALTMFHTAASSLNPHIERRGIAPFEFRICLDHGPVTIARVGAAKGFNDIVAIGTPANLACKMLHVAKANEIMIGNAIALNLDASWKNYVLASTHNTGYHYTHSRQPYVYWYYLGRWT